MGSTECGHLPPAPRLAVLGLREELHLDHGHVIHVPLHGSMRVQTGVCAVGSRSITAMGTLHMRRFSTPKKSSSRSIGEAYSSLLTPQLSKQIAKRLLSSRSAHMCLTASPHALTNVCTPCPPQPCTCRAIHAPPGPPHTHPVPACCTLRQGRPMQAVQAAARLTAALGPAMAPHLHASQVHMLAWVLRQPGRHRQRATCVRIHAHHHHAGGDSTRAGWGGCSSSKADRHASCWQGGGHR